MYDIIDFIPLGLLCLILGAGLYRFVQRNVYHLTPVLEFHRVFGHPVEFEPTVPDADQRALRVKMIAEELSELATASGVRLYVTPIDALGLRYDIAVQDEPNLAVDLVEVADALGDIRYLVDGGNLVYGIPGQHVLREIHRSNMSKLGRDGKPVVRADGKTLKGPDYSPPDIAGVLSAHES